MAENGTGIAGAQDHQPRQKPRPGCWVCGAAFEASHSARAWPGVGVVEACSEKCARDRRFAVRLLAVECDG